MFRRLRDVSRSAPRPACWSARAAQAGVSARWASGSTASSKAKIGLMEATTPLAKKLHDTGVWVKARSRGRRKKDAEAPKVLDPRRVNVVSEELCDDIIKYVGPSLERHRGCDLIDLNPGSGLWSSKLHAFLEPRRHIMMDPDAELYQPFLKDLLAKPNVEMIPQSGFIWKNLLEMLRTRLPDQTEQHAAGALPQRNDTLVVTANLSMYPKKAFGSFDSISSMILYQFFSSIPTQALFHRYGLVRMLLWVDDDDQRRLLPHTINRRRRGAFEVELSCEWVRQVAGPESDSTEPSNLRDEWINVESGYNTLRAMIDQGIVMPPGRETRRYKEVTADMSLMGQKLAGVRRPHMLRPFMQEKAALEQLPSTTADESAARLKSLRYRERSMQSHYDVYHELMQARASALQLYADEGPSAAFMAADRAYNERFDNLKKNQRNELNLLWDGYHLFRQSPPAMHWDRRPYEPLVTRPDEFYPNAPTSLLDIQPKTMHPLFLQHGPGTSRSGDLSGALLRAWYQQTLLPAQRAMDSLWGGFGDLAGTCGSLTDPARGGSPMTGAAALTVRAINEAQWAEILGAWMEWPFRPSYVQLLGRLADEGGDADEDDSRPSAMGSAE